ncbi:MAG: gliding motility-associated C-terminal domain-containing protein [Sphingobacteriaceae bacterium]|nr:gliding motility-associated C-terminal domain-containing protein [Sphingobacteriaceae bacterium]
MEKGIIISCIFFIFCLIPFNYFSQNSYTFTSSNQPESCYKGAAGVQIDGIQTNDTITLSWSNGQSGVFSINELVAGDYNVIINIKNKLDTTINFKIEKIECEIIFESHFTPNGDNYNDTWEVYRTEFYPEFELYIFNKWGQQVHKINNTFKPWDGKSGGLNAADGTYYYAFYFKANDGKPLKGSFTLLR